MQNPELRVDTSGLKKKQHLSVAFGDDKIGSTQARPGSTASSAHTMVAQTPDFEFRRAAIRRRGTHVADVKLSWWDCFKGFLFGTKKLRQKIAAEVVMSKVENTGDSGREMFHDKECPYILTVSCRTSDGNHDRKARCVFDTGCVQGNIISTKYARELGFTQFEPLEASEKNGGTAITGHVHNVIGAVHISWFHSTSPKVFGGMRFLVSDLGDDPPFELIVGTYSIYRNGILSAPNFLNIIELNLESNPAREDLVGARAKIQSALEDAEDKKDIKKLMKQKKELQLRIDIYDTKKLLEEASTDQAKKALNEKLEGFKAELAKYKTKKESKNKK